MQKKRKESYQNQSEVFPYILFTRFDSYLLDGLNDVSTHCKRKNSTVR
jgi:hypothetical protein